MSLYNIKSSDQHFIITKFDDDLNVESSYEFHNTDNVFLCHCPAGQRPTCRHRLMFPLLQTRVDSPWMLDFDTQQWVDPTGEATNAAIEEATSDGLGNVAASEASSLEIIDDVGPVDWDKAVAPRDSHSFRRRM